MFYKKGLLLKLLHYMKLIKNIILWNKNLKCFDIDFNITFKSVKLLNQNIICLAFYFCYSDQYYLYVIFLSFWSTLSRVMSDFFEEFWPEVIVKLKTRWGWALLRVWPWTKRQESKTTLWSSISVLALYLFLSLHVVLSFSSQPTPPRLIPQRETKWTLVEAVVMMMVVGRQVAGEGSSWGV